jgi:hypothetical protein
MAESIINDTFILEKGDLCLELLEKVFAISNRFYIVAHPKLKKVIEEKRPFWELVGQTDEELTLFINKEKKLILNLLEDHYSDRSAEKAVLFQLLFRFHFFPDGHSETLPAEAAEIEFRANEFYCEGSDFSWDYDNEESSNTRWCKEFSRKISELYSYQPEVTMSHDEGVTLLGHMVNVARQNVLLHLDDYRY